MRNQDLMKYLRDNKVGKITSSDMGYLRNDTRNFQLLIKTIRSPESNGKTLFQVTAALLSFPFFPWLEMKRKER